MQNGLGKLHLVRFLAVDKHGFIGIYGLILFTVILSFITLLTTQMRVTYQLMKRVELHEIEVYAIHHVATLMPISNDKLNTSEEIIAFTTPLLFQYEQQMVHTSFWYHQTHIAMDFMIDEDGYILSIAYHS